MDVKVRDESKVIAAKANLTERQIEYVEAFSAFSSNEEACRFLGVTVRHGIDKLRDAIARSGLSDVELIGRPIRIRRRESGQRASKNELYELAKTQEFRCALSGVKLEPDIAALDHKMPISKGGSDQVDNLQWVTDAINKAKGTMTNHEFINMCKQVAKWNN
jgi:hypothetical protein